MTGVVDKRGIYHNRTDESDWNRGGNGKLSGDQLTERAQLHAKRLVFSKPTIQEIADHWNSKYGITMHYQSEKEWASRNEEAIEAALNEMIEQGEIKDPGINETSFITTMNKSGRETAKLISTLEKQLVTVLKSIDLTADPWIAANVGPIEYQNADDKERKRLDALVKREARKNEFRLEVAVQYSRMLKDHKTVLIDTVNAAKDLFQDSKLKDIKQNKLIDQKVSALIGAKESVDEGEVIVTDEMRQKVLGVK